MRNPLATQLLFELSRPGRRGAQLPACDVPAPAVGELLPAESLAGAALPEPASRRFAAGTFSEAVMHSFDVRAALRCATTFVLCGVISAVAAAEDVPARKTTFGNYDQCVEMRIGDAGVLLSPQAGGRVLQFWFLGSQSLYLDEQELQWRRGAKPAAITAGRFDYGPELVVKPHPRIWSGDWTAEIVGSFEVRMTSPRDEAAGMQVVRTFTLAPTDGDPARTSAILRCKQTLKNIGEAP